MRDDLISNAVRSIGTKLPMLLIALSASLVFAACSGSGDEEVEATPTTSASPTAIPAATVVPPTTTAPTPTNVSPDPTAAPTATTAPRPTATATTIADPTATPLPPTPTQSPLGGEFFLNLIEPPELDVFATTSSLDIVGQTRIDAVITVNDEIVAPDTEGIFEHTVQLEIGINIIEVIGSVSTEEQLNHVITVIYLP